ncbi:DUF2189 domain-containing protein [Microbaculum marinum]|uniref:DUF2189 domain-containing protein n=1 Tax=Microbaculum marinum TaxID=1764581 RepID=A0AAW9RQ03_9HYPH
MTMTIRNPVEWAAGQVRTGARSVAGGVDLAHLIGDPRAQVLAVRKIGFADLKEAVAEGIDDFLAMPTHMMFLAMIYPLAGIFFARLMFGYDMLPLLYPFAAGFPLVGPFLAIGLYEMSRRRERGEDVTWRDAFGVLQSPSLAAIGALGLLLMILFLTWLVIALWLYQSLFGTTPPETAGAFVKDVLTTPEGWTLILAGNGIGFVFAVIVLSVSVVSFPLLLDRDVGAAIAVKTSVGAVLRNPLTMAVWGVFVAGTLLIGSLPLFVGLAIVVPVLAHSTWHLYRRIVA